MGGDPGHDHESDEAREQAMLRELVDASNISLRKGEMVVQFRADDENASSALIDVLRSGLLHHGFSELDAVKTTVSVRELIDNVATHSTDPEKQCGLLVSFLGRSGKGKDFVRAIVMDRGKGFDWDGVMHRIQAELESSGREHGLLRAYRYGSDLSSSRTTTHAVEWARWKRPEMLKSGLRTPTRVPVVSLHYSNEAVRICDDVYLSDELFRYIKLGASFMSIILDPIRRSSSKFLVFEVFGHHTTRVGVRLDELVELVYEFCCALDQPKQLILFANAEPEDHRFLAEFARAHSLRLFEDAKDCRTFLLELVDQQQSSST